jgi:hypothetical protein
MLSAAFSTDSKNALGCRSSVMSDRTTISVHEETADALYYLSSRDETYNDVIERLIDHAPETPRPHP